MTIDTGKANISLLNETDNIVLVDIYADGELNKNNVDDIHEAINNLNTPIPIDTICVKSGKNFLSDEAFEYSMEHNSIHGKVIYVIKHMKDIHYPSKVKKTYFKEHVVDFCTSIDEAYHLLKSMVDQNI